MAITLYTAPDCLRCKIVKEFLASRGQEYVNHDFKAEKDLFNAYYRAHRSAIYRNPEGVEFPIFDDGMVIKQGTGEIIAYLLSGHALEPAVTRSHLLHGWISGLNVSACPLGQEDNFRSLVRILAQGGLTVCLQSDGRRPDLLEAILAEGRVSRVVLDILGPASLYPVLAGSPLAVEDLRRSLTAVRSHKDHELRLLLAPFQTGEGSLTRMTPAQAEEAAKMVVEAAGDRQLPLVIEAVETTGLEPLDSSGLLPYRSKVRNFLVKADIRKAS